MKKFSPSISDYKNTTDFYKAVRQYFRDYGCDLNQPADDSDILKFEAENGHKLSSELKAYFSIINGTYGFDYISQLFSLSQLVQIAQYSWFKKDTDYQSPNYQNVYVLGELMINSHQWGIVLNNEGLAEEIIELDYEHPVAKSIAEFLELFIQSPYELVGQQKA